MSLDDFEIRNGSLVFSTANGPVEVSGACVQAVSERAEYVATLTGEYFRASGLIPTATVDATETWHFPIGFLLELGAVLQLGVWERAGLQTHIQAGLPSFQQASSELARRAAESPADFQRPESATLLSRVLPIWIEHFAWSGLELFAAEMQIDAAEEDAFIDRLAEFLWRHRDTLAPVVQRDIDK
jgi:hypothetical protein